MTILSRGGRYCSMITVEGSNALVLDRKIARIATAAEHRHKFLVVVLMIAHRQGLQICEFFALHIPMSSEFDISVLIYQLSSSRPLYHRHQYTSTVLALSILETRLTICATRTVMARLASDGESIVLPINRGAAEVMDIRLAMNVPQWGK
jgi:hypothetical protein